VGQGLVAGAEVAGVVLLRSCLAEIGRLDPVVQSLLGVTRKAKRQGQLFHIGFLLDERVGLLESAAASRAVTLRREGDATIVGDRDDLSRAFDNLLRNAIEASPATV